MSIKDFYEKTGGNYDSIVSALGKEERVYKYLIKFSQADTVDKISTALVNKDYEGAFREAHNLKGMCLNIGIVSLQKLSSNLTESLRNGPTGEEENFFEQVSREFRDCCEMISQISGD